MNEDKIQEAVLYAIKELQKDYTNNLLCHEGSLQSALYMHLRNYLDNQKDGKKIWCELRLKTGIIWKRKEKKFIKKKEQVAVDIGIVNINENKEDHLKNSITEVHALIEIKYVQMSANAKEQFKKKISGNKKTGTKVAELLYKDILKLNKLQGCCMNMSNEDLIEEHAPSIYFIACIEDSKTYKEEFMVIKNGEFISQPN